MLAACGFVLVCVVSLILRVLVILLVQVSRVCLWNISVGSMLLFVRVVSPLARGCPFETPPLHNGW